MNFRFSPPLWSNPRGRKQRRRNYRAEADALKRAKKPKPNTQRWRAT